MKRKILVADDDHDDRLAVEELLDHSLYEITSVKNGEEAYSNILKSHNGNSFDLLITDMQMPVLNGMELIELLRSKNHTIPIIVISGSLGNKEKNELAKHGSLDFMKKPVCQNTLLEKVELLFKN
jgi:CheY-like chemotaxis protein